LRREVEQIRERRRSGCLAPGEAAMSGVQAGIDVVGFQACDRHGSGAENPTQVVDAPNPAGPPDRRSAYRDQDSP
jgi:glutathione-independent formaldehyde dehydrogenase